MKVEFEGELEDIDESSAAGPYVMAMARGTEKRNKERTYPDSIADFPRCCQSIIVGSIC